MTYQVSSKLVWECLQTLQNLAADNSTALCWVPGHRGIDGNEKADDLAKRGAETPYFGLEPVYGISMRTAKTTVKLWTGERHCKQWLKYPDHKLARKLVKRSHYALSKNLLQFDRSKLRFPLSGALDNKELDVNIGLKVLDLVRGTEIERHC